MAEQLWDYGDSALNLNAFFPGPANPTSHTGHRAFHGLVTTGTNPATESHTRRRRS